MTRSRGAGTDPKMVMLAPALPAAGADNAGGRYAGWVAEAVGKHGDVVVLAPDNPSSQRALASGPTPDHELLVSTGRGTSTRPLRLLYRLMVAVAPVRVPWPLARDLATNRAVRDRVRRADVVDLQWEEQGALIPMIRRLNPDARIVCTLHDVLSQRFDRASMHWAGRQARRLEHRIVRRADAVVVFSDKDAVLLPHGRAEVHVVPPPIGLGLGTPSPRAPEPRTVLFVGMLARTENEDGLLWFLDEVWPKVVAEAPDARFEIAGIRPSATLLASAERAGVTMLGFVEDLAGLYARSQVVVAPLRLGAGVKFKVLEALLTGAPVVTTSVGAEGIGQPDWFHGGGPVDSADEFAAAVVDAITSSVAAEERAAAIQQTVAATFGAQAFDQAITAVYLTPPDATAALSPIVSRVVRPSESPVGVTVVIPTYNGAATLDAELEALASQRTSIPFEVLISDNGSTDASREVARRWADRFAAFTIIDSSAVRGVAHARNAGARAALGAKVLICDADDIVCPDWVGPLALGLDTYDIVGAGARPFVGSFDPDLPTTAGTGLNEIFDFLPYALGGSMGVRRESLLAIGGFDSSYRFGHEEADFSWRAQLAGHTVGWCGDVAFTNYRQKDSARARFRQNFYFAKSAILLWHRFAEDQPLAPVSLRAATRGFVTGVLHVQRWWSPRTRRDHAQDVGWTAGLVAGHVDYRIRGRAPARQLMEVAR